MKEADMKITVENDIIYTNIIFPLDKGYKKAMKVDLDSFRNTLFELYNAHQLSFKTAIFINGFLYYYDINGDIYLLTKTINLLNTNKNEKN